MNQKIICRTIDGKTQGVPAADLVFRPSVYGVAVREGKVLLMPQWDGYDFPGGGVELGETIDEAFRREMKEETGLDAERGEVLLCESDFFIHPISKKAYHTILAYYLCKDIKGEISDEHFDTNEKQYAKKAEWVDIARIRDLKFYNPVDSASLIEKVANHRNHEKH
ncbi:MAG: NUDIX domain-containing protein [Patescibacteria group bacterium]